ncbi:endo-1,4-beta-xylanase [Cohnella endophytica]|uniref:Beta-xylanase n=1 Tax=Cohnella endophytica TaxID=2419778 RepID=A0A494XUI0_9BACL|nr:endo-1,4-beta-xylanase [Cohnella endophytica]RKP51729.1 endo-1,4-beta-xylanase [Cohnella endophytica]
MSVNSNRNVPKLHETFKGVFDIGAAVNSRTIVQSGRFIANHYNSLTAENEMKFVSLHPEENKYTFEYADEIVGFARSNGMKVRGHTLVWHNQTSDWLFQDDRGNPVDGDTLLARMKSHIDTVVSRYKEDVYAWDVVNEVIADEGAELLRPSKWLDIAGPGFIGKAFEFAHTADPKALLFYNDYNESHPLKRDKIYALLKSLKEQGIPVHGVGLQAHWNLYDPGLDEIRAAIEKYASLGLLLHLTELDMSVFRFDDRREDLTAPTEELLELQAVRYEAVFSLLREYKEVIDSVTFWGAADDYTWLDDFPVRGRKNWPFLFDEKQQPKSSFWKVVD